jgi:threonylcarbamoyladenosine tRNA methylthiotransferase MtaB
MRRRYTAEHVYERVNRLREAMPDLVLSADLMVGYPTESEAQYLDTEGMVRALEIAYPHVFPYSERDGTPAARIPDARQVPVPLRKERAGRLRRAGGEVRRKVLRRCLGAPVRLLVESDAGTGSGLWHARGADYLPVALAAEGIDAGNFVDAVIEGVEHDRLVARVAG